MQFRSGNHLHRRGCSSQLLTLFIRLRNSSIEREGCSIYATSSLLINAGKGILCKRNGNGFLCSCRQEYPLESAQAVIGHGTVCIALDIELNHLFRVETARIHRLFHAASNLSLYAGKYSVSVRLWADLWNGCLHRFAL